MPKNKMNPKVDWFFNKATKWQEEYKKLRSIVLDSNLSEELKWGCPCYTLEGNNVLLIHGFKDYCAILFIKGSLLNDADGILIQQTKNVQAGRQVRFTDLREITQMSTILKRYIHEAIEVERSGLKVKFKKATEFAMPVEFKNRLSKIPSLKTAFYALTPGRQRGYLLYFSTAKQSKTREARIDKCMKLILKGKGLQD